ncbi:MAG: DUF169 domain-containing protein [Andreesenia angusta]|nr:DUF169 domain-containing protein [Andreesenia angusta]
MINKENAYKYLKELLNLDRSISGARFIETEEEYENLAIPEQKGTVCFIGRRALEGYHIKSNANSIVCDYGAYAIGAKKPDKSILNGESYALCGLYSNKNIAKSVVDSMHYSEKEIYGIEIGPFSKVSNADIVYIVCDTKQAMRVFQGYTYYYGPAKNIGFIGNQAMCGDILSKPLYNKDINISLFCKGARKYGAFGDGELAISMPIEIFYNTAYGVFMTVDPVENPKDKVKLSKRLEVSGIKYEFDMQASYGKVLDEYAKEIEN